MKKRIISLLLVLCLCAALLPTTALAANIGVGDWSNGYGWWSQNQSKYSGMQGWGCLVVAQAKMLVESGVASSDSSAFNPDVFYEWELNNGYVNSEMYTTSYDGPQVYASQLGKILTYEGTSNYSESEVWENIKAGKYTILRQISPSSHYVLVNNGASTSTGRIRYFESYSNLSTAIPGTKDLANNFNPYQILTYSVSSAQTPAPTTSPSVSFSPWSNGSYTYIGETDAAIGQTINVSGGSCGENGMYLYDVNGNFLASAKNPTYTLPQIYFQINAECGYTLTPGTSYKYKFYAVVNGEYYWSDWGTFKTTGTAPATNYSISLNRSSLSMTVGDEAALSATVSPAGPAVTWKSSNEAVVKVVNGNITAVKAGSATITATAAGKTATCKVTVTAAATTPDPVPTPGSGSREQEPNDTIVTANPVSLNTAITGNLYKTSDKDWFEFTLPSAGMVQLSFGHEYVDLNSDCWRTYLYTAENKEIAYFSWKGNATVTEQSCQIGLETGTYYVCVTKSPAYRYDVDYQLTVNFTASSTWETEFNDTAATADPMALNTKYSGSIMNSRDEDWYMFTLPTSETVQLVFGNESVTTFGNNWRTTIYTIENKKVISNTWRGDATTDRTSDECSLAAGTYYVCVEGMIGNRTDETYWITIKTAAGNQPDTGDIVAPFTDVKVSAYYAEPVKWAVDRGVTVGTSATTFSPDATCTNAQILTFIWRAAGSPTPSLANPFTNLSGSEYYAKAAVWAYSMGMVSGTAFDANKACTRAMTMEYLWKQAGSPAVAASGKFTDVPSSAAYATAVAWAVNNGITVGTSNTTFSPDSICTRGQIMTFLYRAEG